MGKFNVKDVAIGMGLRVGAELTTIMLSVFLPFAGLIAALNILLGLLGFFYILPKYLKIHPDGISVIVGWVLVGLIAVIYGGLALSKPGSIVGV